MVTKSNNHNINARENIFRCKVKHKIKFILEPFREPLAIRQLGIVKSPKLALLALTKNRNKNKKVST